MALPRIMVAPNGARKTKSDHPAIPITISEVVTTAMACRDAGADGLHAHVRDVNGGHVLDSGLYSELLSECELLLPGFYVQITTEAVGIYSPAQQDTMVRQVQPKAVSVALKEMVGQSDQSKVLNEESEKLARNFYHWAREAQIDVQHILYDVAEIERLDACIKNAIIPEGELQLLFVLGRYSENQQSSPSDVLSFFTALKFAFGQRDDIEWAVCAFGIQETDCLIKAVELGGGVRVGFENNLLNRDGTIASDNAERVSELVRLMG